MPKNKVRVSDHAILRYMERVHSTDIDAIRKEIQSAVSGPMTKFVGDKRLTVKTEPCDFVIAKGVVITVICNSRGSK